MTQSRSDPCLRRHVLTRREHRARRLRERLSALPYANLRSILFIRILNNDIAVGLRMPSP